MTAPLTRYAQVEALKAAIQRSGLSNAEFARTILLRDGRTIRRWLSGKQNIPDVVLTRLDSLCR